MLIDPGQRLVADGWGNLVIEVGSGTHCGPVGTRRRVPIAAASRPIEGGGTSGDTSRVRVLNTAPISSTVLTADG